jgi:hypothetical protein
MAPGFYKVSTWWLLLPAALLVIPALVVIVTPGRRLSMLTLTSLVFVAIVSLLWPLSHYRSMEILTNVVQRTPDHMDHTFCALRVVGGSFQIWKRTNRYAGPGWENRVSFLLPPQTGFVWTDEPVFLGQHLLPKPAGMRRLHPEWWGDYVDVYCIHTPSMAGVVEAPWSYGVTGRLWLLYFPLSVFPGIWLLGKRREVVRRRAGLCVGCGYDLRGTPGKCPECGREVKGLQAMEGASAG